MKFLKFVVSTLFLAVVVACSSSGGQENADAVASSEPVQQEPASAEMTQVMEKGKTVYGQYCIACHQADGKGVAGAFPPLTQTEWVEGDKTELISLVINGMQGPITVKGEQYNNVMPPHGFLSDEDIAAVLTYVRQSFGNNASEITIAEVVEVRASAEGTTTNTN